MPILSSVRPHERLFKWTRVACWSANTIMVLFFTYAES